MQEKDLIPLKYIGRKDIALPRVSFAAPFIFRNKEKVMYKCGKPDFCPLCRMEEMQDFYSNDKNIRNAWPESAD